MKTSLCPFLPALSFVLAFVSGTLAQEAQPAKVPDFLSKGLVLFYQFNGNADDDSGNKNHANTKGTRYAPGRKGTGDSALRFDGVGAHAQSGQAIPVAGDSPRTVSLWFKPEGSKAKFGPGSLAGNLVHWGSGARMGGQSALLLNFEGKILFNAHHRGYETGTGAITTREWSHLVFTYSPETPNDGRLYLNGRRLTAQWGGPPSLATAANTVLTLGIIPGETVDLNDGWRIPWCGLMDDVRVYDRALTEPEVAALHQYERGQPSFLTAGLVAFYPFDGSANDASGNGLSASLRGRPQFTKGISQQALGLNAASDYAVIPPNPALELSDFTISVWFNSTLPRNRYGIIVSKNNSNFGFNDPYYLAVGEGRLLGRAGKGDSATEMAVTSPQQVNDGRWHHGVFSRQGEVLSLFVDSKLVSRANTGFAPYKNGFHLAIGRWANLASDAHHFDGGVDNLRIYNRALSDQEIKGLYEFDQSGKSPHLPLTDGSETSMQANRQSERAAIMDAKIVTFLKKRAASGSPDALFDLAARYLEGRGVEQDRAVALRLLKDAADLGHKAAIAKLKELEGNP